MDKSDSNKRSDYTWSDWLERTNPLDGLSIREAQNVYDAARSGNYAHLQWIYSCIEKTDPVLMTCVERRASALAELGWKTVASASATDTALADEQKTAIAQLADSLENLDELIEHLALAFFRGYSHATICRDETGKPVGFDLLNSWNFCFNRKTKEWCWNPNATYGDPTKLEPVPKGETVSLVRDRAIDYPALSIYIRHALAERNWGRFLERYGIPPVNVIMPETATTEDRNKFEQAAAGATDGLTNVWPAGSQLSYASDARGVNPFSEFIQHQERLVVLLATGGTLTSLAEAGSGTLAGNAQMDVWQQIVARDAVLIGSAIDRDVFTPYLKLRFPGRPVLAHFCLGQDATPSADELFELGAKAKAAGYTIAQQDLEEASGYTLVKDEAPAAQPGGFGLNAVPLQNAAPVVPTEEPEEPKEEKPDPSPVIKAFIEDAGPAAEAVKALMENPTPDAAKELMTKLPDLIGDKALAAVIADEMAKAMGNTLKDEPMANAVERVPGGNGNGGQFTGKTNKPRASEPTGDDSPKEDDEHTPEEKARMKAFEESVDQKAVEWRERIMKLSPEEYAKRTYTFGTCHDRMAADIKARTGIDAKGWPIKIDGGHAVHIENYHGANGASNQTMKDPKNFGRIGYVLENYDATGDLPPSTTYKDKNNQPAKQISLSAKVDGTMIVSEVVPDSAKKTIFISSAYFETTKKKK